MKLTARQLEASEVLASDARHIKLVGGARSGKTFLLCYALILRAIRAGGSRHAILRFRKNAVVESIWLDTLPKVFRLAFPQVKVTWRSQLGYAELENKSEIWIGGLDDKERVDKILGKEFSTLYYNECSQIPYNTVQVANTRLAQKGDGLRQRAYYDLNPVAKTHWTYRLFQEHKKPDSMEAVPDPENYASMYMNPSDNMDNLDPDYVKSLDQMSAKQRKRFFLGEYDTELEGALWSWDIIDPYRIASIDINWEMLVRIVVAIDPAASSGPEADETGIIVAGLTRSGHIVIIADLSGRYKPIEWANVALAAYRRYRADRIIGERNNGGEMVEANIRAVDQLVPFRSVWASRGKVKRAEPVSSLYERGLVHHAGHFTALEDQMLSWVPSQDDELPSPDRMDACVWAVFDLLLDTEEIVVQTPLVQPYRIL